MKDKSLTVCPKDLCHQKKWGKGRVKRKLGAGAGFIFKGSGFYITDYRSEGYKKAQSDSAKASETTAPKTDTVKKDASKAEAHKPAPKPAAKTDS